MRGALLKLAFPASFLVLVYLADGRDASPPGFNELIGKTFLLLKPITRTVGGGFGSYSTKRQTFTLLDREDVIIRNAVWKDVKAEFELEAAAGVRDSGKTGAFLGIPDTGKAKLTLRFSDEQDFWRAFRENFDQKANYVFQLASGGLDYNDDTVSISLQPYAEGIGVKIKNNLSEPIKVDWTSGSLVDPNGEAHSIIHNGVKLVNRDEYQKPTTIPPGASITDSVVSSDSVEWQEDHWRFNRLFPLASKEANWLNGKQVALFLVVLISGHPDHNVNLPIKITVK